MPVGRETRERLNGDRTAVWSSEMVCEKCGRGPVGVLDIFCRWCGIEFPIERPVARDEVRAPAIAAPLGITAIFDKEVTDDRRSPHQ